MKIYRAGQTTFASFCRQGQFKQWIFSKRCFWHWNQISWVRSMHLHPCWFSFDAYGWVLQQVSCLIYPSDLVNKGPLLSFVSLSTHTFRILWTPLHQSFPWLLRHQKFESNFSLVFLNLNTTWESSILACCRLSPLLCSPSMSVRVCTRMEAIVRTNCWMGNVQQKISLLTPTILHSNIESLMQETRPYFCKSFVDSCVLHVFMCSFDSRFSTWSFCHCAN
jgi:hypothetical protein